MNSQMTTRDRPRHKRTTRNWLPSRTGLSHFFSGHQVILLWHEVQQQQKTSTDQRAQDNGVDQLDQDNGVNQLDQGRH